MEKWNSPTVRYLILWWLWSALMMNSVDAWAGASGARWRAWFEGIACFPLKHVHTKVPCQKPQH
jgi:hypothetical protein